MNKVHAPFSVAEEEVMMEIYRDMGGAWSAIAKALESRWEGGGEREGGREMICLYICMYNIHVCRYMYMFMNDITL